MTSRLNVDHQEFHGSKSRPGHLFPGSRLSSSPEKDGDAIMGFVDENDGSELPSVTSDDASHQLEYNTSVPEKNAAKSKSVFTNLKWVKSDRKKTLGSASMEKVQSADSEGRTSMESDDFTSQYSKSTSIADSSNLAVKYLRIKGQLKNGVSMSRLALVQELTMSGLTPNAATPIQTNVRTEDSIPRYNGNSSENRHSAKSSSATTSPSTGGGEDSHDLPVWVLKISHDGHYLASGHHDGSISVWTIPNVQNDMAILKRTNSIQVGFQDFPSTPSPTNTGVTRVTEHKKENDSELPEGTKFLNPRKKKKSRFLSKMKSMDTLSLSRNDPSDITKASFEPPARQTHGHSRHIRSPFKHIYEETSLHTLRGHKAAVTDLDWSPSGFLLSSSLDGTVKLWHVKHSEVLCTFQHTDSVSCIQFHPSDERIFASGSIDGKLRTWSIWEKKLIGWNEIFKTPITALSFASHGSIIIAGTSTGLCLFYEFEGLRYNTQVHVNNTQSSMKPKECRITGIERYPIGEGTDDEQFLVTASDSRIRIFNLRDKSLSRKYRGADIKQSRISASFSSDGRYVVCASEDKHIFIWDTKPSEDYQNSLGVLSGVKQWQQDLAKVSSHERFIVPFDAALTSCIFAPMSTRFLMSMKESEEAGENLDESSTTIQDRVSFSLEKAIIVAADVTGRISVFVNNPPLLDDCHTHSLVDDLDSNSLHSFKDLDAISIYSTGSSLPTATTSSFAQPSTIPYMNDDIKASRLMHTSPLSFQTASSLDGTSNSFVGKSFHDTTKKESISRPEI